MADERTNEASADEGEAVGKLLLAGRLQGVAGALEGQPASMDKLLAIRGQLVSEADDALALRLGARSEERPAGGDPAADEAMKSAEALLATVKPSGDGGRDHAGAEATEIAMRTALSLCAAIAGASDDDPARRARRTVLRPLADTLADRGRWRALDVEGIEESARALAGTVEDDDASRLIPELAEQIGRLLATSPSHALLEAASGLTRLAQAMDVEGIAIASDEAPTLRVLHNGPYVATGPITLANHLGDEAPLRGPKAFCRCGKSATKPYCDGSHVGARFVGEKSPKRVPDRLDLHAGQAITIEDNRGRCQHSGFCTDRLARVFHVGEEPFVTPSGGRVDEITAAVDRCPSGALWLRFDDREERRAPPARDAAIEVSKDGPYRITGGIDLQDEAGGRARFPEGGVRERYALCRCGASLNKPFCSGMHWSTGFEDPVRAAGEMPSVYEWAGGRRLLLDMTRIFYARHVPDDPLIGPLFATMSPDHPERVAAWLSEVFGGPKLYSERYGGYAHMISEHIGKRISPEQRRHWVALMARSADEAGLPDDGEFRAAFVSYLEWGSRLAVENSAEDATPPPEMPMPRWSWVMDATPRGVSAAPVDEDEVVLPGEDETPGFEEHIKPMFREKDRTSMTFVFDLWKEEDVRRHGPAILGRLEAGTMPCDGAWAKEKVAVFRRWLDEAEA